jgi:phosphomethylpyrimidine synthase
VRDYAAKLAAEGAVSTSEAVDLARKQGMAEMSEKFIASGAEVYVAEE